jgi:hypothetical protein
VSGRIAGFVVNEEGALLGHADMRRFNPSRSADLGRDAGDAPRDGDQARSPFRKT